MNGMHDQLIRIARRKERLIARAASQREAICSSFRQLRGPVRVIDRGLEIARFLREHPLLIAVVAAAVTALRGRGVASVAARALSAWRIWRSVAS